MIPLTREEIIAFGILLVVATLLLTAGMAVLLGGLT
jgi:hypothetical protein